MKIAIGGDHAGFGYKSRLVTFLKNNHHEIVDFGPDTNASVDYPDHVHPVAEAIENGETELGVLICGSGNGVAMAANKHQGVRAAICWNRDLATLARQHNDANIICLSARFLAYEYVEGIVNTFLKTNFEGGRHQTRVDKISC
ncbi:MAG: ribose 5-phosphate isomerase B [Cytophagales bacterium]|nr:ribose 5-phosphate isomerase B [Cytophagales bacterium]